MSISTLISRFFTACATAALLCASPALAAEGDVDPTFNFTGENTKCIAMQPDGRAVVAYGNSSGERASYLTRVNADGTQDPSFNLTVPGRIECIAVQTDGKILLGGSFNEISGFIRWNIARLLPDGSVDPAFRPVTDSRVSEIVVQPDGRILIGGSFYRVAGQDRVNIARLTADGELDAFAPALGYECTAIHVQRDGRILVGGFFRHVNNSVFRNGIARFSPDGVLDETFVPSSGGFGRGTTWFAEQPDGKILIVTAGSREAPGPSILRRVDAITGAFDQTFQGKLSIATTISSAYLQTDGKVLVAGQLTSSGSNISYQLARLHPDGALDSSLLIQGTLPIQTIAPTASGKLMVGGDFSSIRSVPRAGIARLEMEAASTSVSAPNSTSLEWQRSATTPMLERVTFESLSANAQWNFLGHGQWSNGKWRLKNITVPANNAIRARGFLSSPVNTSAYEDYLIPGNAQPQLTVEHGGTVIPAGGALQVGDVLIRLRWSYDLKLTNTGNRKLEQLAISSFTGIDNMQPLPTSLQPGESTTVRVSFIPTKVEALSASITIASNATNAPIYPITISGNGTMEFSPVFNSPTDIPAPGGGSLFHAQTFGHLTLGFAPQPGTVLTAIKGITDGNNPLDNLPDGTIVTADYQGVTYRFVAGQTNSNSLPLDLTFTLLGGDGTFETKFTAGAETLEMEDDGAFRFGTYRMDAAGAFDLVFNSSINFGSLPKSISLINGDVYRATGTFVSQPQLVKIRNDGRQDPAFNAPINGSVLAMAALPDDRLIIGGSFTNVSGQARTSLARLHPDGSVDTTFTSQVDLTGTSVNTIAVQTDGKILVGTTAAMTLPAGGSSNVARFLPDGRVDTGFSLATDYVDRLLVQPDGKIVKLAFTGGAVETLCRYLPDGSLDDSFYFATDDYVRDLALLADGKFLISGAFSVIGEHVARLHPDGTPDVTFLGKTLAGPLDILVSGKNELFIGGNFGSVNGVKSSLAKLSNPTAVTSTALVNANTIRWTRQGAAAELDWVKADFIPQAGGIPVSLGFAQRISSGWEVISPTPLSNGTVRLYGPATHSSGMIVMVKELVQVGTVTPHLEMTCDEQPLPNGVPKDFGTLPLGQTVTALVRMKNVGAGTANAPVATIEGPHAEDYTLFQTSPTALGTGEQRSFLLKIYPRDGGTRSAQLVIRTPERSQPLQVIPLGFQTTNNVINPVFNSASDIPLAAQGFDASIMRLGTFTLNFAPTPTTILTLVSNTSSSAITGTLKDLPPPGLIAAEYNGVTYHFGPNYTGGSGNDLTLKLLANGDITPGFKGGADDHLNGVSIQPDGKAIVTGYFSKIGNTPRAGIARLHPNGEVDTSFNASQSGQVENILTLEDDRILFAGGMSMVNGEPKSGIACLNPDGSLSEDFNLSFGNTEALAAQVMRLVKLRNGKFLVGGRFTSVNGEPRTNLARLNADGTLDTTFITVVAGAAPNLGYVYAIHEQADGRLLIGGSFGAVNGTTRYCFARLNANGSLDPGFNPLFGPNTSATYDDPFGTRVSTVMELPDGKILLGGKFSTISGTSRTNFARLNADGTVDTTFSLAAGDVVTCLNLQADGKVLVGGLFSTFGGQPRSRIVRLRADGTLDPDYAPKSSGTVTGMTLDREGNLWVTGAFTNMNGVTVTGLAKLRNDSGSTALSLDSSTSALWELSGTAPALSEVKFDVSADGGAVWTPLGAGTKVSGGWSITGLALPANGYLRAKGKATGGNRGFSAIEDVILFGRQPTKIEEWRMERFGSLTNQRTGADLADADNDGVKNLMEYAFNLDPQDITSAEVPTWSKDASQFEINFTPPPNVEGVIYGAEWSSTMNPSDWHEVTNQASGGEHRYVVPQDTTPLKFMRVKVTNASGQ